MASVPAKAREIAKYSVHVCKDIDYIRSVMLDPEMWERCSNDYATEAVIDKASCIWLICYYYDMPMGLAAALSESASVVNVHIHIPKKNRGRHTRAIGLEVLRWIKMNSKPSIHKVNTKIPVIHRDVIRFAHSLGFKDEGVDRLSIMKNGELMDRLSLGICLGDII